MRSNWRNNHAEGKFYPSAGKYFQLVISPVIKLQLRVSLIEKLIGQVARRHDRENMILGFTDASLDSQGADHTRPAPSFPKEAGRVGIVIARTVDDSARQ